MLAVASPESATNEYSPSPRHVALDAVHGVVVPSTERGSNAHEAPGAMGEADVNDCVGPVPPSGAKSSRGLMLFALMFCTTIVLTRSEEHTSELQSRLHLVC